MKNSFRPTISLTMRPVAAAFVFLLFLCTSPSAYGQWTTTGNDIYNSNSGNVGIGTNGAPSSLLEVKKSQSAGTIITIDNPFINAGNSAYSGLMLKQAGLNRLLVASVNDNHATLTAGTAQFWNFANAPTVFATNNAERMRLTSTGNLGIGTASPNEKLTILGNLVVGNITSHTQLYSGYDAQNPMIFELGYGTATPDVIPLPSFVLSKNLTSNNQGLGVISFANSNLANGSEKRIATMSAFTDGALNSGALAFGTTTLGTLNERMRIASTGKVGINTQTPTAQLHVMAADGDALRLYRNVNSIGWGVAQSFSLHNASGVAVDYAQISGGITSNTAGAENGVLAFSTRGTGTVAERMRITSTGVVGIGTTNPGATYRLDVQGGTINSSGGLCIAGTCKTDWSQVGGSQWTTSGTTINYSNGNVGIGTPSPAKTLDVTGDINASGNITGGTIQAKYQDVAEWVPSSQELSAGTVVILDPDKNNQVVASTQSYDSRVAGVISPQPGITLGEHAAGRVLVAASGRVRVKVDASNGPIKIGDLLVTSDNEGVAMKSVPIEFAGARIHRPGTLIGKALEPLAAGTGEILVLLSLQ